MKTYFISLCFETRKMCYNFQGYVTGILQDGSFCFNAEEVFMDTFGFALPKDAIVYPN